MHPLLLEIGSLRFHSYPAMLSLAFLVSTLLAAREGLRLKNPVFVPPQGAVWTLVGALFGSKVFFIIQYQDRPWYHAFYLWESGLVFYGGLIGAFFFTAAYLYITRQMDWRIIDVVAPYVALGQAFGRMGCFLNGCCWGRVSDAPWALQFPRQSHAWEDHVASGLISRAAETSLHVHPTQLYSVVGLIAICLYLRHRLQTSPFTFAIFLQYGVFYGLLRFIVEIFRGDSARQIFDMFTVSQTVSLGLVVCSAITYWILERRQRRIEASQPGGNSTPAAQAG